MNTPPTYLPVRPAGILQELIDQDRWVNWLPVWKVNTSGVGKWTKVPKRPNGLAAASTDPATWSTFGEALVAYLTGRFAGIGWVLRPPYTGIDFDGCLGGAGDLDPEVGRWVTRFDSYTELSVSGTGLHSICTTALPAFVGRHVGPRECYCQDRFFTVSGWPWPDTPATVSERTDAVREFLDALGPEPASVSATGPIVPMVPSGRYAELGPRTRAHLHSAGPNGYPSPSEADAAAAAALVATGHTAGEALALLLDSPRGQDALARKGKHGLAYLERTVQHAAAFVGPVVAHPGGLRSHRVNVRRPVATQLAVRRPA